VRERRTEDSPPDTADGTWQTRYTGPHFQMSALLSPSESAAVTEFLKAARALLGPALKEARLFGSRAGGQGHEHSDVDIAHIVETGARSRRHSLYDLAFDVGLAHGVDLAPFVIEEPQLRALRERERRIAREIEVEGIPL
jgi:predicted nucleotidyltransferase